MWHVYLKTTGSLVFCRCGNSKELYDELTQLSETVAIYSTGQIKPSIITMEFTKSTISHNQNLFVRNPCPF